MASPIAAFVQLPLDSGNTGKEIRTQTKVISGNTVHEHFYVPSLGKTVTGIYYVHSGALTIQATADTFPAARVFLINTSATTDIGIARVKFSSQTAGTIVAITSPRVTLENFTFTGTPSGATITPVKQLSTMGGAAGLSVRTASTGLSIVDVGAWMGFLPVACATAVGWTAPSVDSWFGTSQAGENEWLVLKNGQGIAVTQPDAGTSSDARRYFVDFLVYEWDNS